LAGKFGDDSADFFLEFVILMFQISYSSQAIAKQLPIAILQCNFPMQMPNAQQYRSTMQMSTIQKLQVPCSIHPWKKS